MAPITVTIYPAAYIVGASLVAPLALAALMTGIALALITQWRLFKFWWVTIKLALTTLLSGMLLFLLIPKLRLAAEAAAGSPAEAAIAGQRLLLIGPAIASVSLLVAVTLAVFKPKWRISTSRAPVEQFTAARIDIAGQERRLNISHYHGAWPAHAPGNETREKLENATGRPQLSYKRVLIDRIASLSPSSLLDVGCGKGDLLRAVADGGCATCVGIEVDSNDVARLRAEGLKVHHGRAERLPFENGSFDIVVMDYVAHHLKNLEMGLLEVRSSVAHGRTDP